MKIFYTAAAAVSRAAEQQEHHFQSQNYYFTNTLLLLNKRKTAQKLQKSSKNNTRIVIARPSVVMMMMIKQKGLTFQGTCTYKDLSNPLNPFLISPFSLPDSLTHSASHTSYYFITLFPLFYPEKRIKFTTVFFYYKVEKNQGCLNYYFNGKKFTFTFTPKTPFFPQEK